MLAGYIARLRVWSVIRHMASILSASGACSGKPTIHLATLFRPQHLWKIVDIGKTKRQRVTTIGLLPRKQIYDTSLVHVPSYANLDLVESSLIE